MKALLEQTRQPSTTDLLDRLQRGRTYKVTTFARRPVVGEYLGIEVAHGDWAILLRRRFGTVSVLLRHLRSVDLAG